MTHPPVTPRDYLPDTVDFDLAWRWIEALESKRYQQGRGNLREGDAFCSLGVACDVADPSGWALDRTSRFVWHDQYQYLPPPLADRLGLDTIGRRADYRSWGARLSPFSLARANDTGTDFDTIAYLLRDYYGFPPREDQP